MSGENGFPNTTEGWKEFNESEARDSARKSARVADKKADETIELLRKQNYILSRLLLSEKDRRR